MRVDEFGCVRMEKDGLPGDIGDSCAETGRLAVIAPTRARFLNVDLKQFITDKGFIRHPLAPPTWRENDFTSDQMLPLLMATDIHNRVVFKAICARLRDNGYRTAPGKLAAPGVYFVARGMLQSLGAAFVAQALIFKFPWRWSDDKRVTGWWKFVRSEGESADYLNFFAMAMYLKRNGVRWPLKFFNSSKTLEMVRLYYANQPESDWFVRLYENAAND